ncbi:MAG: DNA adenine methylase [Alphaproteobacteria bacterium]|nr:DNA adenine methylase [Alphaproteobacteria bacterium]
MSMQPVKPTKPVAAYIGGKRALAKTIIRQIDTVPHEAYAEPFVGMGGIFLRRASRPKTEVINDAKYDVANLFRVLQRHYQAFIDHLKWKVTSRAEFNRLTDTAPETLTDLERAARFLYLQRVAFGGNPSGKNFGVDAHGGGRFNLTRLEPMLEEVYERLAGVVIECLDYKEFIERYDHKGVLFYLDPPYWGSEGDYGKGLFSRDEFAQMAVILNGIKGRFILSLNDCAEVRKTFAGFHLLPVKTVYTISGHAQPKKVGELLISNVKLKG